jgi:hypothetical protein
MGLPDWERGGPPGGGGIARPVCEVGGRGGAPSGRGARAAGSMGGRAAGRRSSAGAVRDAPEGADTPPDAAVTPGGGPAGGATRRGPSLPLELTMRRDGAVGAAAGGAAGAGALGASAAAGRDGAAGAGASGARAAAGASAGRAGASGAPAVGGAGAAAAGATGAGAGAAAGAASAGGAGVGAAAAAGADFLAPFFSTGGSSGWVSRTRPSRSALRRTRSACASTMLEEWLLTPIPSAAHRSSVSLLVSPSSRASSYTRMFAGKSCPQPFFIAIGMADWCAERRRRVAWLRPRTRTPSSSHDPEGSNEVIAFDVTASERPEGTSGEPPGADRATKRCRTSLPRAEPRSTAPRRAMRAPGASPPG